MLSRMDDASTDTGDSVGLSNYTKTALKGFVDIAASS